MSSNQDSKTNVDDTNGADEEAADTVPALRPTPSNTRTKATSDITGMRDGAMEAGGLMSAGHVATSRTGPRRRKTKSDMVLMMTLPADHEEKTRRRQKSSSDLITKWGYAPALGYDDLKFAETLQDLGTKRERQKSGLSDKEFLAKVEEATEQLEDGFELNFEGLTSEEAKKRLAEYGRNELPEKIDPKWLVFLRQFWAPMPIMIWIAIIIEIGIQNYIDMGILLVIQFTNATISFYESNKAGNAIAALKNSLKPTATCKRDGKFLVIDAAELVPGDTVLLASGSAVPADCRVNHSEIDVDQAALTGESLPVTFYKNDSAKMGSTVVRGEVEATVEFTGANTFFGKTASLLGESHELSHLQIILMKIMFILVGLSLVCCLICFGYLLGMGESVREALSFTIVLLVASIPLAIEIVTTTTLAIGSKNLVKHGAIVAKLSAIEDLAGMSILCSDKTGTLTLNQMVLQDDTPIYASGETQESVLMYAALAAKWHEPARDALDRLTLGSVNYELLKDYEQTDFLPFDPTVKRTEGTLKHMKTGETFKTSKGAPHIILQLLPETDDDVREAVERDVARLGEKGVRSLAVAKTDTNGVFRMMGLLTFLDPPRPDTKQTIFDAHNYGVAVKMITGDHLLIARNTAEQLEMGNHIFDSENLPLLDEETKKKPENLSRDYGDLCLAADGFAQVYPEHKYLIVECLREMGYIVGMTGDGVNDAPALKRADVGIAVAGSTDAARAAADIVLTEEGLSTIIHGIFIAREIFSRMSNFVTYRIAATLQLLFFFFLALFIFKPSEYPHPDTEEWPEFFKMPVLMLMLITLLNDGTLITIAYDYAEARTTPNSWNLPALFLVSTVLGAVSCVSSLVLLHLLLDSWDPDNFLNKLNIGQIAYGEVTSAIYLKVSVSDFLTLFSARTSDKFFWQIKPAPILLIGGLMALAISSLLAVFWPASEPDGIPTEGLRSDIGLFGFVWIYCILFWFLQDILKVLAYKYMYHVNFNNISKSGVVELPDSAKKLINDFEEALASSNHGH